MFDSSKELPEFLLQFHSCTWNLQITTAE